MFLGEKLLKLGHLFHVTSISMSASDQSVGLSAGVGDVLQRLAALEKRMDAIDSTEKGVVLY